MTQSGLRAAVVGAGAIGSALDAGRLEKPLTHAGGFLATGYALRALVDISDQLEEQGRKWQVPVYRDFDEMMRVERPAVVSFALPASQRPVLMRAALNHDCIKAAIAEKPLAGSLAEATDLVAAYRDRGVHLIVNYSRRFIPAWQQLVGIQAISTTIKYAKGIKHNGTHAIDLCLMLFGKCLGAIPIAGKNDYWADDPTVTSFLRFERCPEIILQGLDERHFTMFEVDIVGPDFRVIVDHDGRRLTRFALDINAGIPPGRRLLRVSEAETGTDLAMINLMRNASDVIGGARAICTGEDAIASLKIAQSLSDAHPPD